MPIFSKYYESSAGWVEWDFCLEHSTALAVTRWLQSGINLHPCSLESRKRMLVFSSKRYLYPWKNCIHNFPLWDSANRGERGNQTTFFWQKYLLLHNSNKALENIGTWMILCIILLYLKVFHLLLESWIGPAFLLFRHLCLPEEVLNYNFLGIRREFLSCLNSLFSVPVFWADWVGWLNVLLQNWLYPLRGTHLQNVLLLFASTLLFSDTGILENHWLHCHHNCPYV